MRILIRTSRWAIWARRFGSLALPLAVIPVFLHRERLIVSADFNIIEIVAMTVAAIGLVLSLGAFVRLWITGDQGWSKATMGFVMSLLCLAPLALILVLTVQYPSVGDVSTDPTRPPGLVAQVAPQAVTAEQKAAVAAAFPNARNRTYPIEAAQMYALVNALVEGQGWELRARREPQTPLAEGQINAVATTLLGWRDEVAIRIEGDPQGSIVAMRSASLSPGPDLGENGRRVEAFLAALDQRVTELLRAVPTAPASDPDAEAEPEVEEGDAAG